MTTDFIVKGKPLRSQPNGEFIATPQVVHETEGYWTAEIQYHATETGRQLGVLYLGERFLDEERALKAAEDQMWDDWMQAIAPMVTP